MVSDKYVVLIPARGGSKSIKLKNIKVIAGQPLIYWSLDAAVNCNRVSKVYVSTDSDIIKKVVKEYNKKNKEKIVVVDRSKEAATDTATTEDVEFDFCNKIKNFENLILIQATNPMITTEDIDGCLNEFPKYDSVVSTVIQKRFYWEKQKDGSIKEIKHDIRKRPRRQEWEGVLAENGSIYIISRENLYKGKCRLFGKIGTYVMPDESYYEIDEETDWVIIENLLINRRNRSEYGNK